MGDTDRKLFVLDTNILLHEPLAIYSFKEHDVVIPMTVLEELDRIKDSKRDVARDARVAIRALEHLFHDATPEEITEGSRFLSKRAQQEPSRSSPIMNWMKPSKPLPIKRAITGSSMPCFTCKLSVHHAPWCW